MEGWDVSVLLMCQAWRGFTSLDSGPEKYLFHTAGTMHPVDHENFRFEAGFATTETVLKFHASFLCIS